MSSMISLLMFSLSITSIICLDCSVVTKAGKGLRLNIQYEGKDRKYRLSDKNGSEWTVTLGEVKGQIDIIDISEPIHTYNKSIINRFGLYCDNNGTDIHDIAINCFMYGTDVSEKKIICNYLGLHSNETKEFPLNSRLFFQKLDQNDPIVFKPYAGYEDYKKSYFIAYDRNEKTESVEISLIDKFRVEPNILLMPFIEQMDEQLYRQIDSVVDFNLNSKFGHIIWFYIDGRNYYCVQPFGPKVSEECSSEEKLKDPFPECNDLREKDFKLWIIGILIAIVFVIIIIAILVVYLKRSESDPNLSTLASQKKTKTSVTSKTSQATNKSSVQFSKAFNAKPRKSSKVNKK